MPKKNTLAERFAEKTIPEPTTGCLLWIGAVSRGGYGIMGIPGGRLRGAHRVSWELANGPIPDERLLVLHSCDNPPCVNPQHLRIGTDADNSRDMVQRKRHVPVFGERNKNSKLKEADVHKIRSLAAEGYTRADIAKRFGISTSSVNGVVNRRTWTRVP